jgi:hypothetical protein
VIAHFEAKTGHRLPGNLTRSAASRMPVVSNRRHTLASKRGQPLDGTAA